MIDKFNDHSSLCGYGRVGRGAAAGGTRRSQSKPQ
jgi:hypothetical protein